MHYSFFYIWISRLLTFFSMLPHIVFWITKSPFNLSFLEKIWFTLCVNSFMWVGKIFISSPSTTLSFSSMIFFVIYGFFKTFIAPSVISNRFGTWGILLDLENREISQLKTDQNMYCLLDTSSQYSWTHRWWIFWWTFKSPKTNTLADGLMECVRWNRIKNRAKRWRRW